MPHWPNKYPIGIWNMNRHALKTTLLCIAYLVLTACSGGNGHNPVLGKQDEVRNNAASSLTLRLVDADDTVINSVTESQSGTLIATLLDEGGRPVADAVITFVVDNLHIGALTPASGTALTNTDGVGKITLHANNQEGASNVVALAQVSSGLKVTDSVAFSTTLANLALGSGSGGSFTNGSLLTDSIASAQLSAGGTLTLTATIVDVDNANALFHSPVLVSFTSICADQGKAAIDNAVTTTSGTASATYRADGCVGPDTITATAPGGLLAQTRIEVAAADAGSIDFYSVSSQVISIKGTGETGNTSVSMKRPEAATVIFIVRDINGNPLPGHVVDFALTNSEGGITLQPEKAISDSNGRVQTVITSGVVQASVRVRASFTPSKGPEIFTFSNILVISTGLPDQNSFSIAPQVLNPEALNFNGVIVGIAVIAGDRFNNPVPDGTPVNFVAEGGVIEASCFTKAGLCTIKNVFLDKEFKGVCPDDPFDNCVEWISGSPKPGDGKITILATAVGEESFVDANNNGRFDDGEPVTNLPEAFLDIDENSAFDAGTEFFRDFNGNLQYDAADIFYNGSLCTDAAIALGHCANLINVRDSAVMVMASSQVAISFSASSIDVSGGFDTIDITIADIKGNAPPFNSEVVIATSAGKIDGQTKFKIPSQLNPYVRTIGVASTLPVSSSTRSLTVTVTSPSGVESVNRIPVTDGP